MQAPEEVLELLSRGEKQRHYGSTKLNDHSSRSHTVFRMSVECRIAPGARAEAAVAAKATAALMGNTKARARRGGLTAAGGGVQISQLSLIDLAGSERAQRAGTANHAKCDDATADMRLHEGAMINKSLMELGLLISKLSERSSHQQKHAFQHVDDGDEGGGAFAAVRAAARLGRVGAEHSQGGYLSHGDSALTKVLPLPCFVLHPKTPAH